MTNSRIAVNNKGMNSHVTKSVVPLALIVCDYTNYTPSNSVGMADLITPTSVGGKAWMILTSVGVKRT